jgi:hypothetical protein
MTIAQTQSTTRKVTLPLKANLGETMDLPHRASRKERRACQKYAPNCDSELIYYLKVEAMYQDRTPALARILHGKGKRFLERFDTADITWERRYTILASAVRVACMIDNDEEALRESFKSEEQQEMIRKNHDFLTKGIVGHSGPRFLGMGRDSKIPT